jgi:hypothetical protein
MDKAFDESFNGMRRNSRTDSILKAKLKSIVDQKTRMLETTTIRNSANSFGLSPQKIKKSLSQIKNPKSVPTRKPRSEIASEQLKARRNNTVSKKRQQPSKGGHRRTRKNKRT